MTDDATNGENREVHAPANMWLHTSSVKKLVFRVCAFVETVAAPGGDAVMSCAHSVADDSN